MTKYGKLKNGKLTIFHQPIHTDVADIFTTDSEILLEYGWKKIIYNNPEEKEGYYPTPHWEETDKHIVQIWQYEPIIEEY